jgi:transcriptional regulator of aromatic amino acid metabolism
MSKGFSIKKLYHPWTFTMGILIGSMFGDFAWIIKAIQHIWLSALPYSSITFFIRIAWGFVIIQYQSLALFMQSLIEKNFNASRTQKLLFIVSGSFACYFFYLAFFEQRLTEESDRELAKTLVNNIPLELRMTRYTVLYLLNMLILPGVYKTFIKIRAQYLPKILRHELTIFMRYLVCPYIIIEFIQTLYLVFSALQHYIVPAVACSTILLIYTTYYCMQKILCLQFLASDGDEKPIIPLATFHALKSSIDALGEASSVQELNHIVQFFFNQTYHIPMRAISLHLRPNDSIEYTLVAREQAVEHFLNTCNTQTGTLIEQTKILSYDSIIYDQFYNPSSTIEPIINFLTTIDSDIFIPIYNKRKLIAYISVKRDARGQQYYTRAECDEMLLFSSYLTNIISLLQNHNIEKIMQQLKFFKDELYIKNQEINLYREGISTCAKNKAESHPGILFYHNRRFIIGNHRARTLLTINLNEQAGHRITKTLKKIALEVALYKTAQTTFIQTETGTRLLISATAHLERNYVIITITHPDVTDILLTTTDRLSNPIAWENMLHLETTHAGALLNQFLPSTSHAMVLLKTDLLCMSIRNAPIAIHACDADATLTGELLHTISKREKLYSICINRQTNMREIGIKIFGINQIVDKNEYERPLLETLNGVGSLYIHNVDLLDHSIQQHLADFMCIGLYSPLKSEQRFASDTRIICSTAQSLDTLHGNGTIITTLYTQLVKHSVTMPNPTTLPESELAALIDGIWQQLITTQPLHHMLKLPEHEKLKLIQKQSASLHELKMKLHQLFSEKIQKMAFHQSPEPLYINTNAAIFTPETHIFKIAQLGKHALKDQKLMTTLWHTFKNQNKIATLLKVNRSSVNRRCKEYNLL